MDPVTPGADDAARPGPAWGRAIPFVAVIAFLVAIVGTSVDVHIVDSWGTPSLGAIKVRLAPRTLEAGRLGPAPRDTTNQHPAWCRDASVGLPGPAGHADVAVGVRYVANLGYSVRRPNARLCPVAVFASHVGWRAGGGES
ncbi:MAG: hypothetical protein ACLP36_03115 [Acidimicrobiales bacterium]|jgi:hypothetical protein